LIRFQNRCPKDRPVIHQTAGFKHSPLNLLSHSVKFSVDGRQPLPDTQPQPLLLARRPKAARGGFASGHLTPRCLP
jgi:hypothetical protein